MNENLDLTKILDGCPEGTEFYNTVYGKVSFVGIRPNKDYPIKLKCCSEGAITAIAKDGRIRISCDGECTLFPSKEQRDWSKFERFWDEESLAKSKKGKFDPKTLQPFDKVLVKDDDCYWTADLFSHIDDSIGRVCCSWYSWKQCIPYNEDTKHLVGTTDDCPEYYKWWEE